MKIDYLIVRPGSATGGSRPDRAGPLAKGLRTRGCSPAILTLCTEDNEKNGEVPVFSLDYPQQVAEGRRWDESTAFKYGVTNFRWFAYCQSLYERLYVRPKTLDELVPEVPAAFSEVERFFSENEIKHVIHPNMGGEIIRRVVSRVARARGIPVLYESGTRYFEGHSLFVLDEMGSLIERPRLLFREQPERTKRELLEWLDERRSAKPRVKYGSVERRFVPLLKEFLQKGNWRDVRRIRRAVCTSLSFAEHQMTRLLARPLNSGTAYVYYPIHYTIESNIILRSPSLIDQEPLLVYLSKILPQDISLCIKQHPGYRAEGMSFAALRRLVKYHQIHLLPMESNSWDIISGARAVVTIHGTAGFEGLLMRKPVVVLGHPPYRGWGVTEDVQALDDLPQALDRALKTVLDNERLLDFLVSFRSIHVKGDWYSAPLDGDAMADAITAMFARIENSS